MSSFQEYLAALRRKATEIRIDTLKMISAAESGAVGSALSCVEIMTALYYGHYHAGPLLNIDPGRPGGDEQDYFVLSKAAAAPTWYAILADLAYFDKDELRFFKQPGALLTANPRSKIPGVPLNSGSPGQGIAGAVGLAMAVKMDRQRNKVFVLAGDGELATGMAWEALLQAGHNKLGNLVLIVDRNGIQFDGVVRNANVVDPISDKLDAMGFRTINVFAGHDFDQLLGAYEKAIVETRIPVALICKTVKAKGVDFAENKNFYHDKPLSKEELKEALASLERKID
jgi:transketolase